MYPVISLGSITVALWVMAIANVIAAGFWAAQFTIGLRAQRRSESFNVEYQKLQHMVQSRANELMDIQIAQARIQLAEMTNKATVVTAAVEAVESKVASWPKTKDTAAEPATETTESAS